MKPERIQIFRIIADTTKSAANGLWDLVILIFNALKNLFGFNSDKD